MDAKNLRIGNLFQAKSPEKSEYEPQYRLDSFSICQAINNEINLKPIAISEDWLRKFNFKYYMKNISGHPDKEHLVRRWQHKFFINGNEWWFDFEVDQQQPTNFFWLNWNFGGSNHFVHLPRKIEYVHELQNLFFALTGQELELKTESSTCG